MNILLTAFEPFGGRSSNVSHQMMQALPHIEGLTKMVLPVSFRRAPAMAVEAVERVKPDLVISLGEAPSRAAVCIERVALNLMHTRTADNDGFSPRQQSIVPGGPDGIFTPVDVDALAAQLDCTVSNSAGLYVCNTLYYTLLHRYRHSIPSVFVHFPGVPVSPDLLLRMLYNI